DDAMKSSEQLLISSDQSIKNIIESLEEGESKSMTPQEINWNLFSFTGQEKPNSCAGKNCLCICDEVLWENSENVRQVNECNKNGVCTIVSNLKNEKVNIELQKDFATEILISKQNNEVSIK
ncbi:MAG: hypothetical protein Q8Q86_03645, partial [Candidatus Daviesbacteria bacterium]|nr:hypothetical protein [Candidatus Daviesbacteria bacterium]